MASERVAEPKAKNKPVIYAIPPIYGIDPNKVRGAGFSMLAGISGTGRGVG
jgi:hypothetical protein